jgi:hypothetical protein
LLEGATLISPLSGRHLAAQLRRFAAETGGIANVHTLEQTLVLGQSLGGLNDFLLRQALGSCLPPVDPNRQEVDAAVWNGMGDA